MWKRINSLVMIAVLTALFLVVPVQAQEDGLEQTAVICVNSFVDENSNGLHEPTEGFMAGVTFTVRRGEDVVGEGISSGREEAICFPGLAPDTYQILQDIPQRLVMTTASAATIVAEAGKSYAVEFGSRLPDETITNSGVTGPQTVASTAPALLVATPTSGGSSIGAGGFLGLLVLGLGILGGGVLIFWGLRG